MLSMSITIMVLKRLKFRCPTNNRIDACMRKGKKFQNSSKINKQVLMLVPKFITVREGIPFPNYIIGVSP